MAEAKTEPKIMPAADPDFIAEVVKLRDDEEKSWKDIAEELECQPGKAMLAHMIGTMPAKFKINTRNKDDDALGALIVKARDEDNHSWGFISARAQIPESRVRKLYADTSGVSSRGLRIGKGGRYPGDDNPNPVKPSGTAKKATGAAKKATGAAKKATGAAKRPAGNPLLKMDFDQLSARINGKIITVDRDGKPTKIKVSKVLGLEEGVVSLSDTDKKNHSVELSAIKRASK